MSQQSKISAILGPTNTGKTYVATERMLSHTSGMMGFPLRLLARENYDKVAAIRGKAQVALITGEEQIVPDNPRYFICTVEAMPLDRMVEFVCVDEIQLAADPDRGHIFTDRILNARGLSETMFIGSDTIEPLLRKMVPGIEIQARARFSTLKYTGYKKIVRLPPRSAIVAFSASDVYALAEFMRRQRGGTAVVMGALSPRARNAQVGMYQSGEVDFIVATDAIGMGLNMDIDHVAFSTIRKFDGRNKRTLRASEMGQIAGRAGRYQRNGTFGTTADEGSLPDFMVQKIENHKFDPVHFVFWRNSDLDFSSIESLRYSLNKPAPREFYKRPMELEDQEVLDVMFGNAHIRQLAQGYEPVKLLWEVCQVPDYRRLLTEIHARFLMQIYEYLWQGDGRIPESWVEQQVAKLDRYDGDMDAIMTRLAHVRIWTYIANRQNWIANQKEWQERTRAIEDRLSDALHIELTQRFVDKRVAILMKKLDENAEFTATVADSGDVLVEGQFVGRVLGLRFAADQDVLQNVAKGIRVAARKAVMNSLPAQVERLIADNGKNLSLARNNEILWVGRPVARLQKSKDILQPGVQILCEEELDAAARAKSADFLSAWINRYISEQMAELMPDLDAGLSGAARGLFYQLREHMGLVDFDAVSDMIQSLPPEERERMQNGGVVFGSKFVYVNLYAPKQTHLRAQLWGLQIGQNIASHLLAGKLVVISEEKITASDARAMGFAKCNHIYIRADRAEAFYQLFSDHFAQHRPIHPRAIKPIAALNEKQILQIAEYLGFSAKTIGNGQMVITGRRKKQAGKSKPGKKSAYSPFAELKQD